MKRICVLGGGRQGRVVAADLAADYNVTVVDLQPVEIPGTVSLLVDLSDSDTLVRTIAEHDLAIGAVPAKLGYGAARAAVEAGRNYIDLAYSPEDPAGLHGRARAAGVAILPDCGLAPGISNLVVGRAIAEGMPDEIHIKVGGFAEDPAEPYGYAVTWSIDDLLDEYTRPARIVSGGETVTVPALSGLERLHVDGVGELEAFFTDGLRTLLTCGVRHMTEKTLRWPGHVDLVRPLVKSGGLVKELRAKCASARDIVVFRIDVVRAGKRERVEFTARAEGGLSAMARTTALPCAAFARWLLSSEGGRTGVVPPERIGADRAAYDAITGRLARRGIRISWSR